MAPLPVDILLGIYLGVLTGIIPALVAGVLGFLFKYVTNVTLPGFGVVVLGVALAGINGGLLALADPAIMQSANAAVIVTGLLVVMMMTLYAHAQGDKLGVSLPRRLSLRKLSERTLSTDLTEVVGGRKEVRIRVGTVEDIEGYPPLPAELRTAITDTEWRLPADLQVSELETRLAERLRTEHDLGDVTASIDEQGAATVAAAPPFSGLSRRVGSGRRAVSVGALVPTGLARGDVVTAHTGEATVRGTVLSARSTPVESAPPAPASADADTDADADQPPKAAAAPTTRGGQGQVTLDVARGDVERLLTVDRAKVVVGSRGTGREYEVISLLRRAGRRFDRVTVRAGGALDGTETSVHGLRDSYDVVVLAARTDGTWQFAPRGKLSLTAGDELFAVGTSDALAGFSEAVA